MRGKSGYALALMGGVFWAVGGICGQLLFDVKGMTSDWLIPYRLGIAGLILLVISLIKGRKIFAPWRCGRDVVSLLIFALIGTVITQYGYYTAIYYSNAATSTVLNYVAPAFIISYTALRQRKMPSSKEIISVICVIIGVVAIATHFNFGAFAISPKALFWGIFSAVGFAVYTIQPKRLLDKFDNSVVVGWGMLIGGIATAAVCRPWRFGMVSDVGGWACLACVIIVGTVLSFSCYLAGVQRIGPTKGSLLSAAEPVVSAILSIALLNVEFNWADLVGFVLIIGTVPLLAWDEVKKVR